MILITGFTGNTGSIVLKQLLEIYSNDEIVGITRDVNYINSYNINVENLELEDTYKLDELFKKYEFKSVIHIANIRYSPYLMDLANMHNVDRVILVHTTGIYSKYRSYSSLYKEIEKKILSSFYKDTAYTILRPTMIYGNEKDHNMHKLIKFLSKYPAFPIFGTGKALMQPVHVNDLADAILLAHESEIARNKSYDLSGGSIVEYIEVLKIIQCSLKKRVIWIPIPIKLAIIAAKIYKKLFKKSVISVEQVERLQEDKAYSNELAQKELGFAPRPFKAGITEEVKILKEKGLI